MRKILCLVIISLFFFSSIFPAVAYVNNNDNWIQSQKLIVSEDDLPNILWDNVYGNGKVFSVEQTSDGGYIFAGSTWEEAFLIKTDINGNKEWETYYGGEYEDGAYCVMECSDGGYISTGWHQYTLKDGLKDTFLFRTDENGNELWYKTFRRNDRLGGAFGRSVIEISDGYVVLAILPGYGTIEKTTVWLMKTDKNGNELWNRTYGGNSASDIPSRLIQAKDGGFVFTGSTSSYDISGGDAWLMKIDSEGNEIWNKSYGGYSWDTGDDVIQTDDGGYMIVGGYTPIYNYWADVGLFKTDSFGNLEWIKHYGGGDQDSGYSVTTTEDGGYMVVGMSASGLPSPQGWMLKTDGNGNKLWDKVTGGSPSKIIRSNDGNYVVAGGKFTDEAWLFKFEDFENNIPSKPTIVYNKNTFQLKVTSIDPDGDRIRYGISWYNNKVVDEWTEYYDSGIEGSILCLGKDKPASVVAEDEHGGQSEWVTAKIKTRTFNQLLQLLESLFERLLVYLSFVSIGGGY